MPKTASNLTIIYIYISQIHNNLIIIQIVVQKMQKQISVDLLMPQIEVPVQNRKTYISRLFNKNTIIKFVILIILVSLILENVVEFSNFKDFGVDVTIVVLATGQIQRLNATMRSFVSDMYRNYDFVVVYDGQNAEEISQFFDELPKLMIDGKSINWVVTGSHIGQIASIDLALQKVKTPFVFISSGPWIYNKQNFIKQATLKLTSDKHISQVMVTNFESIWETDLKKINNLDTPLLGFNTYPSLHRMKPYRNIQGGYSKLTWNTTYSLSAHLAQNIISDYYINKGYRVQILNSSFATKVTNNRAGYGDLELKENYLYQSYWKVKPEEINVCTFMISVFKSLRKQQAKRRHALTQLGRIISINSAKIDRNLEQYGIDKHIQIASIFDYLAITGTKEYLNISQKFPKVFNYQQKRFDINLGKPEQPPQTLTLRPSLSIQQVLNTQETSNLVANTQQISLSLGASLYHYPKDEQFLEAQYSYYASKYGIDKVQKQLKICLFVEGKDFFSRSNLYKLVTSINNQNYTNYQIVYVSDQNNDFSREKAYWSSVNYNSRAFNRIKSTLKNQDSIGTAGNHYLRMQQFCKGSDIVVTLNGNSSFIGRQALNVINTIYQNSDVWLAFFAPIKQTKGIYTFQQLFDPSINFRANGVDTDEFLVTYRYDLGNKLPISHVMQFQADLDQQQLKPKFYETQSNTFHVYSYAQMSGVDHIRTIKEPVYFHQKLDNIKQQCWLEQQAWTKTKSTLKFPLNPLTNLSSSPTLNKSQQINNQHLKRIKDQYQSYQECLTKINKAKYFEQMTQSKFENLLNKALQKMLVPNYYLSRFKISQINQMPFCLIVSIQQYEKPERVGEILRSISNQNYSNITLIHVNGVGQSQRIDKVNNRPEDKWVNSFQVQLESHSFLNYLNLVKNVCPSNSLLMFVNEPLKSGSLSELNQLHQTENSWMTYTITDNFVQINSIYMRVYELIFKNDFAATNRIYLEQGDQSIAVLAALELCPKFSTHLDMADIYITTSVSADKSGFTYLRANRNNKKIYSRYPYQYLLNLEQDYQTDLQKLQKMKTMLHESNKFLSRPLINSHLSKFDLLQAFQYEQIPYLPQNHMLNQRQYEYLDQKFQIGKYMSEEYRDKQVRFCFTVIGRNNTQNDRYLKSLKSILMQNYTNYLIVFVDDFSSDNTMKLAMDYLIESNFPKDRIKFIKNKKRTYATYNIINAAFNYCHEDDVQVRFDGDDLLIGRNVLGLVNAEYQKNQQLWLVYTAFKTSQYSYGLSSEIERKQEAVNCQGGRRYLHFIAPLTTWRVKLIRSIPLQYHKLEFGGWLNTLYDDALQFPMMQLASINRIRYVPYFTYNYNIDYGSNDNSNSEKVKSRISVFEYVISSEELQPLQGLDDPRVNNPEVAEVFIKDMGRVFEEVKL